jgi:hypothetical protein
MSDKPKRYKKTVRNVLLRARRLVRKGWTQCVLSADGPGPDANVMDITRGSCFCVVGAVRRGSLDIFGRDFGDHYNAAMDFMRDAVFGTTAPASMSLPAWNDRRERTQAEVVDAFTRAIALTPKPSRVAL